MSLTSSCKYWWDDSVKYGLSVVTEPTAEPVSVQEAREHCRIYVNDDDAWLSNAITAARRLGETFIKRTFVTTTLRLTIDELPDWDFYLPRPNLVSVTSIKYRDSSNVQQTISSSDYTVDTYTAPGRVTPAYGLTWPSGISHTNAVEVVYVAGYGAASAVPASIKHAILLTVADWHINRENEATLPEAAKTLLRAEVWGYLP